PGHHSAMRHVSVARREIGIGTIFNLLGPLTNPASAPNQLLGVYDPLWIDIILDVLRSLGSEHVLIVIDQETMDEISIASDTRVGELRDGNITHYVVKPEDFGIRRRDDFTMLQVADPAESLVLVRGALTYENEAAGDIVALNAGAAMYAANVVSDIGSGVARAQQILRSGDALRKLEQLAEFTHGL